MKKRLFLILSLLGSTFITPNVSAGVCLEYEPTVVSVSGKLVRETYPGRPNYESVKKGDEPESVWVLKLDQPVCVNRGDEVNEAEKGIQEIQLALEPKQYDQYRPLLGKQVSVSGTLFHSHTGHHHKRLLLTMGEMKKSY